MLTVPVEVWDALGESVASTPAGQGQYQDRVADLNVTGGELRWSGDAAVQTNGKIHVVGNGEDLIPRTRDALLAPYGQEVTLTRNVQLRDGIFPIPLGVYRITGNDGGRFNQRAGHVLDWDVHVSLADRFRMLQRGKIVNPATAPSGATMYGELQRLSLFPLEQSTVISDRSVPRGMVYEDRISGVYALAALAGAKPRLTRQGALTLRPADRWLTETVPEFDIRGTITWRESQSDDFHNFVWAHSDDGRFSAFASLDDDSHPLSVNRAGPSTYEHSSPVYTSNASALQGAQTILNRLLNRRSRTVTVEVGAQGLLLELSDFGWVRDPVQGRAVLGEVAGITISHDPTEPVSVTLIVAEEA